MAGQASLSGNLTIGQGTATDFSFPNTFAATQLALLPNPKSFVVAVGVLTKTFASPAAFVPFGIVGQTSEYQIKKCSTLYVRTVSEFEIRITSDDGLGGSTIATMPFQGTLLIETPELKPIQFIEIKGEGLVEYLVTGKN